MYDSMRRQDALHPWLKAIWAITILSIIATIAVVATSATYADRSLAQLGNEFRSKAR